MEKSPKSIGMKRERVFFARRYGDKKAKAAKNIVYIAKQLMQHFK